MAGPVAAAMRTMTMTATTVTSVTSVTTVTVPRMFTMPPRIALIEGALRQQRQILLHRRSAGQKDLDTTGGETGDGASTDAAYDQGVNPVRGEERHRCTIAMFVGGGSPDDFGRLRVAVDDQKHRSRAKMRKHFGC